VVKAMKFVGRGDAKRHDLTFASGLTAFNVGYVDSVRARMLVDPRDKTGNVLRSNMKSASLSSTTSTS
jgi:hypothetical protein